MKEIKLTKKEKKLAVEREILAIKSIFQRGGRLKDARIAVQKYLSSIKEKK